MSALEGIREQEAAKKRCTTAHANLKGAKTMMESVKEATKTMMDTATNNEERAQLEVDDAESFLKEVEERFKVIDFTDDDDNLNKPDDIAAPDQAVSSEQVKSNNGILSKVPDEKYKVIFQCNTKTVRDEIYKVIHQCNSNIIQTSTPWGTNRTLALRENLKLEQHKENKEYRVVVRDTKSGWVLFDVAINHWTQLQKNAIPCDGKNFLSGPAYVIIHIKTALFKGTNPAIFKIVTTEEDQKELFDLLK